MFSLMMQPGVNNESRKRFYKYDLQGNQLSSFGSFKNDKKLMLQGKFNQGAILVRDGQLVFVGSIENKIFLYEDGNEQVNDYELSFVPDDATAKKSTFKNEDGDLIMSMRVEADTLCVAASAYDSDSFLMLRAVTHTNVDEGFPPVEVVKMGYSGKAVTTYPGSFAGFSLAVGPDLEYAYILAENDEGWYIREQKL